jgi:hypothetical protein
MTIAQALRALWTGETRLAKASFLFAALSTMLVLGSWFPHGIYVYWIIYPLHLAIMVLMGSGFVMFAWRNLAGLFREVSYTVPTPLPVVYWVWFGASLVYFLAVFFGYVMTSPQRTPLGHAADLRIAASAYLLMSLGSFGLAHTAGRRRRAGHAA